MRLKKMLQQHLAAVFFASDIRKHQIVNDIEKGSDPRINYYLLLIVSALIATFGLIANSPAVVIGAMLVSPLMTPIFGISLGLVTSDFRPLCSASNSVASGVILAITGAVFVGVLPVPLEATPEILARTNPTLLDLVVASLAGFAGCLAMIDERISPLSSRASPLPSP